MADKYKVPSDAELNAATEVERLIMYNVDANAAKYWNGYCLANGDFYCEYGRVQDAKGDCRHDYYTRADLKGKSCSSHLSTKVSEKLRKGYTRQKIAGAVGTPVTQSRSNVNASSLKQIAVSQIKGDSETQKLVSWLAEVNVHNITHNTTIKYNAATGSFTTPLGTHVSPDGLFDARHLLTQLSPYIRRRDWSDYNYKQLLGEYLQIIPQDVGRGRGWHETFFSASDSIQKQNDIIDALEAALTSSASTIDGNKADANTETVFNVELGVVSDTKIIDAIKKKYRSEKGNHYDVQSYDVRKVWTVHITIVREAFQKHGKQLGNIKQLWHGTKASNLLSILKSGLVIPRSSDPHVCGRMFGDGLYFSDQSTKSIRYATGAWTSYGRTDRVFMFICDVAMGKEYTPPGPTSSLPPKGYDSYFAKASRSGVANNEMIVPNTYQADLVYLVEFGK